MADGRLFTDYRPRCDINYISGDKQMNSYDYRQYLIRNAGSVMTSQRSSAYSTAVCGPCMPPYDKGTMLPEQYVMECDGQSCSVTLKDPRGLGLGRNYGNTPDAMQTRAEFLMRKEMEQKALSSSANCCATPADNLDYHAPAGSATGSSSQRSAVPSGAAALSGGDAAQ